MDNFLPFPKPHDVVGIGIFAFFIVLIWKHLHRGQTCPRFRLAIPFHSNATKSYFETFVYIKAANYFVSNQLSKNTSFKIKLNQFLYWHIHTAIKRPLVDLLSYISIFFFLGSQLNSILKRCWLWCFSLVKFFFRRRVAQMDKYDSRFAFVHQLHLLCPSDPHLLPQRPRFHDSAKWRCILQYYQNRWYSQLYIVFLFSTQYGRPGRGKSGKICKISGEKLFFFHRKFRT